MKDSYNIIDGRDEGFILVPATNANVRRVCTICIEAAFKNDDERLFYAQEGDIMPDGQDEAGNPVYTLRNIYMQGSFYPALAQTLFFDFPEIVSEKKGQVEVIDKKLYDQVNRGEVKRAFGEFMGEFVATPYEVKRLLTSLESGQIQTILEKVKNALPPGETIGLSTKPNNGDSDFSEDLDTGKQ